MNRLHPLSIPYRIAQQGIGVALAIVFVGVPTIGEFLGPLGGFGAVGLAGLFLAAVIGYGVAYYRRFEYDLTADTFDIESGVFARREREIPLRRIQNVDISQNVVQRVLDIAEVRLETAGGSTSEAQLRYVGTAEAERLQTEISRLNRAAGSEGDATADESDRFETIFAISPRELGVLALVSMDFRAASLLFFGASIFAPSAMSFTDGEFVIGPEGLITAALGPVAGIALVILFGLASGVLDAARYYGFTLRRGSEELRYERGLLQRFSGTIPLGKIQTLSIRENALARALGYAALYIETAGGAATQQSTDGSQSAVPIAESDRVYGLARDLEPFGSADFERPPRRARERYAARYAIVLAALAALLFLGAEVLDRRLYWYLPLAALVFVPVAAHLKWKHRGYALHEDHVVTRNGFWVRETKVVPYHRVQTVIGSQTVFQRRRRLATVAIDTAGSRSLAGNDPQAVDIDAETAQRVRERVADSLYDSLADRRRAGLAERRFENDRFGELSD